MFPLDESTLLLLLLSLAGWLGVVGLLPVPSRREERLVSAHPWRSAASASRSSVPVGSRRPFVFRRKQPSFRDVSAADADPSAV
ncbi:hypothetical protein [Paenibacillus koleovorans]|uniref:hypothetical protein n=1 Tax=Paenibacillus koleovorans TaxID=121608 RepID=UPI000FDA12B0|nr:hypothetical protein [Paenibacillus koleovorans]